MALTTKQTTQRDKFRTDMTTILGNEMGQQVTVRTKTKTIDANGKYTGATTSSATKNAIVSYITQDNDILVTSGKAKIGDARIFLEHDSGLVEESEIIDQNSDVWRVVEIYNKPEVYGTTTEIHALIRRAQSKA